MDSAPAAGYNSQLSCAIDFTFEFAAGGKGPVNAETARTVLLLWGLCTEEATELIESLGQQVADPSQVLAVMRHRRLLVDPVSVVARCHLLRDTFQLLACLSSRTSTANVQEILSVFHCMNRYPPHVMAELHCFWMNSPEVNFHEFLMGISTKRLKDFFGMQSLFAISTFAQAGPSALPPTSNWSLSDFTCSSQQVMNPVAQCCTEESHPSCSFTVPVMTSRSDISPKNSAGPARNSSQQRQATTQEVHVTCGSCSSQLSRACSGECVDMELAGAMCQQECDIRTARTERSPKTLPSSPTSSGNLAEALLPFDCCWKLVCPDNSRQLTLDEAHAILFLLGAEYGPARSKVRELARADIAGHVAIDQVADAAKSMGLEDQEGPVQRCELFTQAWRGLSSKSTGPLSARQLAEVVECATQDPELATDFYRCCLEMRLEFVSLADFVLLMLQPPLANFRNTGGLDLLGLLGDEGEVEKEMAMSDSTHFNFMEQVLVRFLPAGPSGRAAVDQSPVSTRSRHWHKTELFFDTHCLKEVTVLEAVKVRVLIVLITILAAGDSALFAWANVWLSDITVAQVHSDNSFLFFLVSNIYSLLFTIGELSVLLVLTSTGAVLLAWVVGVTFSPEQVHRRVILSAFLRAALDQSFSAGRVLGVDPVQQASRLQILILSILVTVQRGVLQTVMKVGVRKLLPRILTKNIQLIEDWATVVISLLFGVHATWTAMTMSAFCCLGPTAAVHTVLHLFNERDAALGTAHGSTEPFSDTLKLAVIRAIGVTVAHKMRLYVHPNTVYVVSFLQKMWLTSGLIKRMQLQMNQEEVDRGKPSSEAQESRQDRCWNRIRRYVQEQTQRLASEQQEQQEELATLRLDDRDLFLRSLEGLKREDFTLVLAVLTLGVILNGDLNTDDFGLLLSVHAQRREELPVPSLAALGRARQHLFHWYRLSPQELHAVFSGSCWGCFGPWRPEFYVALSMSCARLWAFSWYCFGRG